MEELDIITIRNRSIRSVFALVSRTFVVQLISQIATFVLTIILAPSDYGVFFIVSTVIVFLTYFSDIGLAAALIQKKEPLTQDDLKTTFTIQLALVTTIVLLALYFSNFVGSFYNLDQQGTVLYQALVIAFFLSSLKTIPSIILERKLQFQRLVIPEIVETLVFNITVLTLAFLGFGITSFTFGVLLRGITGVIVMYIIAPWKISLGISKEAGKKLLTFGIPFQTNSFLAVIKDQFLVIYLGKVLSFSEVGFIGIAQKWSLLPLRLIMDNIIRITFPSFSRLSHDKNNLSAALEKVIFTTAFLIFPSLTGMALLMPYFVHVFPAYQKWEPALLSLCLFSINSLLSSISTPLTNVLNAIGKIKTTLYLMIFWTVSTWILTPIFIFRMGFNGVAAASALVSLSVFLVVFVVNRYVKLDIVAAVKYPFISTCVMGSILYLISPVFIINLWTFFLTIVIGGMIYMGIMYVLSGTQILVDIKLVIQNLKTKS